MGLPIRIELANVVTVQCLHDADPREHRRASVCRDQDQRFHCHLPLRRVVLSPRKLRDVFAGILQRDKLAAAGQRYWLVRTARTRTLAIAHRRDWLLIPIRVRPDIGAPMAGSLTDEHKAPGQTEIST